MLLPWATMKHSHTTTTLYTWGGGGNRQQLAEEEEQAGAGTAFRAYGQPLETVTSFKYLGNLLTVTKYDWTEVIVDLQKARKIWSCLYIILGREGADPRTSGRFSLAVNGW